MKSYVAGLTAAASLTMLTLAPSAHAERPVVSAPTSRLVAVDASGDVAGLDKRVDITRVVYGVKSFNVDRPEAKARGRALVVKVHYEKPARHQQVRTWVGVNDSTFVVLYNEGVLSVARTTPTPAEFPQMDWYRAGYVTGDSERDGYLRLVVPLDTFTDPTGMPTYALGPLATTVRADDGSFDRVEAHGPLHARASAR